MTTNHALDLARDIVTSRTTNRVERRLAAAAIEAEERARRLERWLDLPSRDAAVDDYQPDDGDGLAMLLREAFRDGWNAHAIHSSVTPTAD